MLVSRPIPLHGTTEFGNPIHQSGVYRQRTEPNPSTELSNRRFSSWMFVSLIVVTMPRVAVAVMAFCSDSIHILYSISCSPMSFPHLLSLRLISTRISVFICTAWFKLDSGYSECTEILAEVGKMLLFGVKMLMKIFYIYQLKGSYLASPNNVPQKPTKPILLTRAFNCPLKHALHSDCLIVLETLSSSFLVWRICMENMVEYSIT